MPPGRRLPIAKLASTVPPTPSEDPAIRNEVGRAASVRDRTCTLASSAVPANAAASAGSDVADGVVVWVDAGEVETEGLARKEREADGVAVAGGVPPAVDDGVGVLEAADETLRVGVIAGVCDAVDVLEGVLVTVWVVEADVVSVGVTVGVDVAVDVMLDV